MKESKGDLYIPVNTPDADDYISGIGKFEVLVIAISMFASITVAIVFYVSTNNVIAAVVIAAIILGLTITIARRDNYNENLIRKLKVFWAYSSIQKKYYYVYYNIYELGDYENEEE